MRKFSEQEWNTIFEAMQNFRLPLLTRLFNKVWFAFFRWTFLPLFLVMVSLFIIYNSMPFYSEDVDLLWKICKTIMLFYIFGIGGIALLSHIVKRIKTNRLRKKLGLTWEEFNYFATVYQKNE